MIQLSYRDNGCGVVPSGLESRSPAVVGTKLIGAFLEDIRGELIITGTETSGFSFVIEFPDPRSAE